MGDVGGADPRSCNRFQNYRVTQRPARTDAERREAFPLWHIVGMPVYFDVPSVLYFDYLFTPLRHWSMMKSGEEVAVSRKTTVHKSTAVLPSK